MQGATYADSTMCMHGDLSMFSQSDLNHTTKRLGHIAPGAKEFPLESMDCGTLQQRTIPLSIVYPTTGNSNNNSSISSQAGDHSTPNHFSAFLPANSNHHVFFIQPNASNSNPVQHQHMTHTRQCEQKNSVSLAHRTPANELVCTPVRQARRWRFR